MSREQDALEALAALLSAIRNKKRPFGGKSLASALLVSAISRADTILSPQPIPMRLHCPECGELHVDDGEWATREHTSHACQFCGAVWRPAVVATVGVRFLPGYRNESVSITTNYTDQFGKKAQSIESVTVEPPRPLRSRSR